MNSFAVLQGFSSENVQDYVQKQQQQQAAQKAQAKAKPAKPANKQGNNQKQQNKAANRGAAITAQIVNSKDLRENDPKKNHKSIDRNRLQPRRGRAFDRYNPPGKGSKRPKKGGAGGHNWGRPGEGSGLNETGAAPEKDVTLEKTDALVEKAEQEGAETTPAEGVEGTPAEETQTEEKPKEEEDNTMTYEEFMKQKESEGKLKPQVKEADVKRLKDTLKKEKLAPLQKPEETTLSLGQKSNKQKSRKHKKRENAIDLAQVIPDEPQQQQQQQERSFGGRGGRGGARGGRGGDRGGRGGARGGPKRRAPNTQDEAEFPSL